MPYLFNWLDLSCFDKEDVINYQLGFPVSKGDAVYILGRPKIE